MYRRRVDNVAIFCLFRLPVSLSPFSLFIDIFVGLAAFLLGPKRVKVVEVPVGFVSTMATAQETTALLVGGGRVVAPSSRRTAVSYE